MHINPEMIVDAIMRAAKGRAPPGKPGKLTYIQLPKSRRDLVKDAAVALKTDPELIDDWFTSFGDMLDEKVAQMSFDPLPGDTSELDDYVARELGVSESLVRFILPIAFPKLKNRIVKLWLNAASTARLR